MSTAKPWWEMLTYSYNEPFNADDYERDCEERVLLEHIKACTKEQCKVCQEY